MKRNTGTADKMIRLVIIAIATLLYFADVIDGYSIFLFLIPFALMTLANVCPLYSLFRFSTHKEKH